MRKNILKRLIDNLSGADLRKVRKDPMEIMGMEHPSEAAQLYVVRQNPEMIQFIGARLKGTAGGGQKGCLPDHAS